MAAVIARAKIVNGAVKAVRHRVADGVAGRVLPDREVVRLAVVDAVVVDDARPAVNEQQMLMLMQGCPMTGNTRKRPMISYAGSILVVASGLMAFFVTDRLAAQAQGTGQQDLAGKQTYFQTPDTAVKALLKALKADDDKALLEIFGAKYAKQIIPTDRVDNRVNRMRAYRAAQEMLVWEKEGKGKQTLIIGYEAWPMPIPLVKEAKGWRFDTASGIDEIISRRIGRHELSAIEVSRAYSNAQKSYASRDRDGDKVLEYAQIIKSNKGKHDGLYWEASLDKEVSPFGPLVAEESDYLEGRKPGDPFKGYYFKILTMQGKHAPGGRHDYVINGNMIAGFAMVAYPADYGTSGIKTFLVGHNGTVLQKDLGPDTPFLGRAMHAYNPDDTWKVTKD